MKKIVVRSPLMDLEGAALNRQELNRIRAAEAHMDSNKRAGERRRLQREASRGNAPGGQFGSKAAR